MKTLFILASVVVVLFLAEPNKIEAQKKATNKSNRKAIIVPLLSVLRWYEMTYFPTTAG